MRADPLPRGLAVVERRFEPAARQRRSAEHDRRPVRDLEVAGQQRALQRLLLVGLGRVEPAHLRVHPAARTQQRGRVAGPVRFAAPPAAPAPLRRAPGCEAPGEDPRDDEPEQHLRALRRALVVERIHQRPRSRDLRASTAASASGSSPRRLQCASSAAVPRPLLRAPDRRLTPGHAWASSASISAAGVIAVHGALAGEHERPAQPTARARRRRARLALPPAAAAPPARCWCHSASSSPSTTATATRSAAASAGIMASTRRSTSRASTARPADASASPWARSSARRRPTCSGVSGSSRSAAPYQPAAVAGAASAVCSPARASSSAATVSPGCAARAR